MADAAEPAVKEDGYMAPATLGPRATILAAAVLWCLFSVWAVASPLMGVPDEPDHTIKAASIWQGQLRGQRTLLEGTPGMSGTGDVYIDEVRVPESYASAGVLPTCWAFRPSVPATCAPDLPDSGQLVSATTKAGSYPPLFYALVGWPSRIVQNDAGAYLMRLVSAAITAAIYALAMVSLSRLVPAPFAVLAIVFTITPTAAFLAGSINPAGLEVAAAALWWSALLSLLVMFDPTKRIGRPLVAELVLGSVLLSWTRGLGVMFLVVAAVLCLVFAGFRRVPALVADRRIRALAVAVGLAALSAVLWVVTNGVFDSVIGSPLPEGARPLQELMAGTDDYVRQLVAIFGWKDTGPVTVAVITWSAAMMMIIGVAVAVSRARATLALGLVTLATVFLPVLLQLRSVERDGFAWQGRYILPIAVGVPILAVASIHAGAKLPRDGLRRLFVLVLSLWAVAVSSSLYFWLHRAVVGGRPDVLNPMDWVGWNPPVSPTLLLALGWGVAIVPVVAVGWSVGREAIGPADTPEPSGVGAR